MRIRRPSCPDPADIAAHLSRRLETTLFTRTKFDTALIAKICFHVSVTYCRNNHLFSVDFTDESQDMGVKSATFIIEKYCRFKILDGKATTEHHSVSKFKWKMKNGPQVV
jgi:hypothetical protein